MNINKIKLKVVGTTYKLKFVENSSWLSNPNRCAECDYINKVILVALGDGDGEYPDEWLEETVTHELAHAFLYESGQEDINDERHAELLSKYVKFIQGVLN